MLVYGTGLTVLFAVSALYHERTWSPAHRTILQRIDHANIFVLIAATYTPLTVTVLSGWWRVSILIAVWGLALAGVSAAVAGVQLPRWARTGLYVGVGWIALAAKPITRDTTKVARMGLQGAHVITPRLARNDRGWLRLTRV